MAYEGPISAMPGKEQWSANIDGIVVGVLNSLRPRDRPKKRRIQNFLETSNRRTKSVNKCGCCGLWGHQRSTCKNPLSQTDSHPSQLEEPNIDQPSAGSASRVKLPIRRDVGEDSSEELMLIVDDDPLIQL